MTRYFIVLFAVLFLGAGCVSRSVPEDVATPELIPTVVEGGGEREEDVHESSTLACEVVGVDWTFASTRQFNGNNATEFFTLKLEEVDGAYQGTLVGVLSGVSPAMRVYEAEVALYEDEGELFGSLSSEDYDDYADVIVNCGNGEGELLWRLSKNQRFGGDFFPLTDMLFFAHRMASPSEETGIRSAIIASLVPEPSPSNFSFMFDPVYQDRYARVTVSRTDTVTDDAYIWLVKQNGRWEVAHSLSTDPDVDVLIDAGFPDPLLVL